MESRERIIAGDFVAPGVHWSATSTRGGLHFNADSSNSLRPSFSSRQSTKTPDAVKANHHLDGESGALRTCRQSSGVNNLQQL